ADLELELQWLSPGGRRVRNPDDLHDLLRAVGDLSDQEIAARTDGDGAPFVSTLTEEHRAIRIRVAGEARAAAAEDAARFRDALGAAVPRGLPGAFTTPVADAIGDLLGRYAGPHDPSATGDAARRLGMPVVEARDTLARLESAGRLVHGEFRPGGSEREWCDVEVLRRLRRRSLAVLRREVEPVDQATLARFLPAWQGLDAPRRGLDALVDTVAQLQGAAIPASVLERDALPARVDGYSPGRLDELVANGEVTWIGAGGLGASDGRVVLCFRDQARLLAPPPADPGPSGPLHDAVRPPPAPRAAARAEGTPGGFAGVYPALRGLEESGKARRGYFVAGLGAAQFALPGAVDRLRAARTAPPRTTVLAATDPAQPYGGALAWPA